MCSNPVLTAEAIAIWLALTLQKPQNPQQTLTPQTKQEYYFLHRSGMFLHHKQKKDYFCFIHILQKTPGTQTDPQTRKNSAELAKIGFRKLRNLHECINIYKDWRRAGASPSWRKTIPTALGLFFLSSFSREQDKLLAAHLLEPPRRRSRPAGTIGAGGTGTCECPSRCGAVRGEVLFEAFLHFLACPG